MLRRSPAVGSSATKRCRLTTLSGLFRHHPRLDAKPDCHERPAGQADRVSPACDNRSRDPMSPSNENSSPLRHRGSGASSCDAFSLCDIDRCIRRREAGTRSRRQPSSTTANHHRFSRPCEQSTNPGRRKSGSCQESRDRSGQAKRKTTQVRAGRSPTGSCHPAWRGTATSGTVAVEREILPRRTSTARRRACPDLLPSPHAFSCGVAHRSVGHTCEMFESYIRSKHLRPNAVSDHIDVPW